MWRAVNFEIHLWSSGMNADCIWRSISIQHVQIEAGLNSDPGNDSFRDKIRDAKHVLRSTHYTASTCRSTQVKIYTLSVNHINWPLTSRDVYFFGNACNALGQSASSFGACVCQRRPALFTSSLLWNSLPSALRQPDLSSSQFSHLLYLYLGFPVNRHF